MRQKFFLTDAVLLNERLQWDEDDQCGVQLEIGMDGQERKKKVNKNKQEEGGGRGVMGKTC